jgi:adenylate cyclase
LTLLVTDLEAFTSMTEQLGDAPAQQVIRLHNQVLRSCLRRFRGREVFHSGDGMLAVFDRAARALDCARGMQLALQEYNQSGVLTPFRVRIGIHAGLPLREEKRLFGSCVNAAVRICSVAEPERILVSDAVLEQLDCRMWNLSPRGSYPLRGLAKPVALSELLWREAVAH